MTVTSNGGKDKTDTDNDSLLQDCRGQARKTVSKQVSSWSKDQTYVKGVAVVIGKRQRYHGARRGRLLPTGCILDKVGAEHVLKTKVVSHK